MKNYCSIVRIYINNFEPTQQRFETASYPIYIGKQYQIRLIQGIIIISFICGSHIALRGF